MGFVNCVALVSVIINVGGGFFVDANLAESTPACSFDTRRKCLRAKNKKSGKKCAWRLIEEERQCVPRLSCSGISTKRLCNKKKKKRACSWKEDSITTQPGPGPTRNLRTKGGTCVTEEPKSQWDPCPPGQADAQYFCSLDSWGDLKQCTNGCLLCRGPPGPYPDFIECHDDLSVAECSSESGMWCEEFSPLP